MKEIKEERKWIRIGMNINEMKAKRNQERRETWNRKKKDEKSIMEKYLPK